MRVFPAFAAAAAALALALAVCPANALEQDSPDFEALEDLNLSEPDRHGLRRDTWYFLGYQWITIGILYIAPESVSGWTDERAFWYSVLLSCMYEFGAEALFEEVSIQDLIVTPIGGTLVGRYFMNVRHGIRDREVELGCRRTRDKSSGSLFNYRATCAARA